MNFLMGSFQLKIVSPPLPTELLTTSDFFQFFPFSFEPSQPRKLFIFFFVQEDDLYLLSRPA